MKRLLIAGLLALALGFVALAYMPDAHKPYASGDLEYRSGGYTLRLTDQPCGIEDYRAELEEAGIPPARATITTQAGQPTITGCWALTPGRDEVFVSDPTRTVEDVPIALDWFSR